MRFSLVLNLLVLAMVFITTDAVKKELIDIINVCERFDPDLSKCFCNNFNDVLPKLKDGVPQMNIVPIDPFLVENVKIDLTRTQTMRVAANLENLKIYGWNKSYARKCGAWLTSDGIQLYLDLNFPEVVWKSRYNAVGNLLLIGINTTGDFHAKFTELKGQAKWNSTRHMKNNEEYLVYTGDVLDMTMENMVLHFSNLFGNNTQLNDEINRTINENIETVYEEIKPVMMEAIRGIFQKIVNDFHETFPYDLLYPKE